MLILASNLNLCWTWEVTTLYWILPLFLLPYLHVLLPVLKAPHHEHISKVENIFFFLIALLERLISLHVWLSRGKDWQILKIYFMRVLYYQVFLPLIAQHLSFLPLNRLTILSWRFVSTATQSFNCNAILFHTLLNWRMGGFSRSKHKIYIFNWGEKVT